MPCHAQAGGQGLCCERGKKVLKQAQRPLPLLSRLVQGKKLADEILDERMHTEGRTLWLACQQTRKQQGACVLSVHTLLVFIQVRGRRGLLLKQSARNSLWQEKCAYLYIFKHGWLLLLQVAQTQITGHGHLLHVFMI